MEEFEVEQTVFLRSADCEPRTILPTPLPKEAAETALFQVGMDIGVRNEGKFFLVRRGEDILEARLYLVHHDEAALDGSRTVAERALLLHVDLHGGTDTLARNLHQPELAQRQDGVAGLVPFHLLRHDVEEFLAILGLVHVDKIDNHDAPHVAQSQLAGYLLGALYVDLQGGILLATAGLDVVATVDIDDMHCLGVLDIEIDAGTYSDNFPKGTTDVARYAELLKNRGLKLVVLDNILLAGVDGLDELFHLAAQGGIVNIDGIEIVGEHVAQQRRGGVEFRMYLCGGIDTLELLRHLGPAVHKMVQIGIQFGHCASLGHCAHNDSEVLRTYALQQAPQAVAFLSALDFLRNGNLVTEGGKHKIAPGDGYVARKFGALGGNRLLGNLYQDRLADLEHIAQVAHLLQNGLYLEIVERRRRGIAVHGQPQVFVDGIVVGAQVKVVHETLFVAAQVDESGVEALHDFLHLAEEDIAHGILARRHLFMEFDETLVLQQGYLDIPVR